MVKKRLTRVGVVLPDLPLYVRDPKEKFKSVEEIHQNLVLKQRKEVVDICSGLYLRLEHVKKALPKSLQVRIGQHTAGKRTKDRKGMMHTWRQYLRNGSMKKLKRNKQN
ncbi:unnamed protein product [Aphanomyces euteiches]